MPTQRRLVSALVLGAVLLAAAAFVGLLTWDPSPTSNQSFDRGRNGLWLGHRWYTGVGVRDGEAVTTDELDALVSTLERRGFAYAFIHVGPVLEDGTIEDEPGAVLAELGERAPDVVRLAWVGARVERIPLTQPSFREGLVATLEALRDAGFAGVHFDFEPLHDRHPGYLDTLDVVRESLGPDFVISQATPRAGPFGASFGPLRGSFWSEEFYRETMARSDQTVVMAYDTGLEFTKGYVAFVKHQTEHLGRWACDVPDHELLVGLPSYEDVPTYSNPEIENLRTASKGVRAALEADAFEDCLSGVAVYAYWVTDEDEWRDFERHWLVPASGER